MLKPIIKIDRVTTVKEALELENLGVDFIVVQLSDDPRFTDNRNVSINTALDIKQSLKRAKLVWWFWIEDNYDYALDIINKIWLKYIQQETHWKLPNDLRKILKKKWINFIYSNIVASYEDEQSWILDRYKFKDRDYWTPMFYDVDLLWDMGNSRYFLKNESPLYKDELLQIEEIRNLTKDDSLLITFDYNIENIKEILENFPDTKWISMTIVDNEPIENDIHYFRYKEIVNILKYIKIFEKLK